MVDFKLIDLPTLENMGSPLKDYPATIQGKKVVALDIETYNPQGLSALDFNTSAISTIQFSNGKEIRVYDILKLGSVPIPVKNLLEDENVVKVIHNASFEYNMLIMAEGIELKNIYCTMIAEQVCQNGITQKFSYAELVKNYFKVTLEKESQKVSWATRPLSPTQVRYIARDVLYLFHIYGKHLKIWEKHYKRDNGRLRANFDLEMELLPIFCLTEQAGVYFNTEKTKALCDKYEAISNEALKIIQGMFPLVTITSTDKTKHGKKWKEVYPDGMKLPSNTNDFKRALKSLGVALPTIIDKETREERESLSAGTYHLLDHPSREYIQEFVAVQKLLTSYIYPLLEDKVKEKRETKKQAKCWIHPIKQRAFPSILQTGTVTARPAYKDPPLQTLPKLKEFREQVEVQYDDYFLIKADYSQIELRVGAVVANDKKLIQAFFNDEDIHLKTAHEVLGVPMDQITEELRGKAKPVNFGFLFDQTGQGFKDYAFTDYGVEFTLEEAKEYKKNYLNTYEGIKRYQYKIKNDTKYHAYHKKTYIIEGLTGRVKIYKPGMLKLVHKKGKDLGLDECYTVCKDVINFPIQNGNAEIMKRAMLKLNYYFEKEGLDARMILQVHDEIVVEAHKNDAKRVIQIMKGCMEAEGSKVLQNKVPVKVEISYGKNWANMKKVG